MKWKCSSLTIHPKYKQGLSILRLNKLHLQLPEKQLWCVQWKWDILYLWILMWVWSEVLAVKDLPQISQVKGFSPIKKKPAITFDTALPTQVLKSILYFTNAVIKCVLPWVRTDTCSQVNSPVKWEWFEHPCLAFSSLIMKNQVDLNSLRSPVPKPMTQMLVFHMEQVWKRLTLTSQALVVSCCSMRAFCASAFLCQKAPGRPNTQSGPKKMERDCLQGPVVIGGAMASN